MLKKILHHKIRFALLLLSVLLFALIRIYEDELFYDPFLNYFKSDFNHLLLPEYNTFKLVINLLFRYGLNAIISIGIIQLLFKDMGLIKFVSFLYVILFVILLVVFFIAIQYFAEHNILIVFYIRRFLIQPIFVLLFVPAFLYQKWT